MRSRRVLSLFLAAAILASGVAAQEGGDSRPLISGVPARVSDGDTLNLGGSRIRLRGVDAPELAQTCLDASGSSYACGEVSRDTLRTKIGDSSIDCREEDRDQYGRVVAVCSLPLLDSTSLDLNGWLVQQGLAVAYRAFTRDYVAAEDAAREARQGLWAGAFQMPEDFRRFGPADNLGSAGGPPSGATPDSAAATGATAAADEGFDYEGNEGSAYGVFESVAYENEWNATAPAGSAGSWSGSTGSTANDAAAAAEEAPPQELPAIGAGALSGEQLAAAEEEGGGGGTCDIKGNISASGDRIYHTPGSPAYDSTTINLSSGERWFCSAEEAEAAGWRAPRRR